jgi:hypothetical protein
MAYSYSLEDFSSERKHHHRSAMEQMEGGSRRDSHYLEDHNIGAEGGVMSQHQHSSSSASGGNNTASAQVSSGTGSGSGTSGSDSDDSGAAVTTTTSQSMTPLFPVTRFSSGGSGSDPQWSSSDVVIQQQQQQSSPSTLSGGLLAPTFVHHAKNGSAAFHKQQSVSSHHHHHPNLGEGTKSPSSSSSSSSAASSSSAPCSPALMQGTPPPQQQQQPLNLPPIVTVMNEKKTKMLRIPSHLLEPTNGLRRYLADPKRSSTMNAFKFHLCTEHHLLHPLVSDTIIEPIIARSAEDGAGADEPRGGESPKSSGCPYGAECYFIHSKHTMDESLQGLVEESAVHVCSDAASLADCPYPTHAYTEEGKGATPIIVFDHHVAQYVVMEAGCAYITKGSAFALQESLKSPTGALIIRQVVSEKLRVCFCTHFDRGWCARGDSCLYVHRVRVRGQFAHTRAGCATLLQSPPPPPPTATGTSAVAATVVAPPAVLIAGPQSPPVVVSPPQIALQQPVLYPFPAPPTLPQHQLAAVYHQPPTSSPPAAIPLMALQPPLHHHHLHHALVYPTVNSLPRNVTSVPSPLPLSSNMIGVQMLQRQQIAFAGHQHHHHHQQHHPSLFPPAMVLQPPQPSLLTPVTAVHNPFVAPYNRHPWQM